MKLKSNLKIGAVALLLAASGAAQASQGYSVEVWIGPTVSRIADANNVPGSAAVHATFDWTGPINWNNGSSQNPSQTFTPGGGGLNLFGNFVTGGTISNYNGNYSLATLQNTSLSDSGYGYSAFFQITGTYSSASTFAGSITHDDGASLYTDSGTIFQRANPTTAVTENFTLAAGTHNFTLDYVEANGSPSVLQIIFPSDVQPVPEPETYAMLLAGLGLMGFTARRRKKPAA